MHWICHKRVLTGYHWWVTTGDGGFLPNAGMKKTANLLNLKRVFLFITQLPESNAFQFSVIVPLKVKNGILTYFFLFCFVLFLFLFCFEAILWLDQPLAVHSFHKYVLSACYEPRVWISAFQVGVDVFRMEVCG